MLSLSKLNMYQCINKVYHVIPKRVRFITEFRIPRTEGLNIKPTPIIYNYAACKLRDKGLVLGVYFNENINTTPTVLTASAEKYNDKTKGKLWNLLKLSPIPKLGEARVFYDIDPHYGYVAVVGLGTECLDYNSIEKLDERREAIRIAAATGAKSLSVLKPATIDLESFGNAEAAAEGAALALWQFQEYKERPKRILKPKIQLYDDCDNNGWEIGLLKAESQNLARYLQEMPANLLNPTKFAKIAVDLLCDLNINVEIKTQTWAINRKMGSFAAISKSSVQPPLYVEISYTGTDESKKPLLLIGKGVTFDSGCLDLKQPEELRYMKGDMAGAACVVAITRAIALNKIPMNIRGLLPLCELMPTVSSPKYGDVIETADDKSIRIRTPSRAGRLLIADSLCYARNYTPEYIIDIGTMSKELMYTLGGAACACYTNCEELFEFIDKASCYTGDRIWRMPLWKFYEDRVTDCLIADTANTALYLNGDSPNCAGFLKQFISDNKWIHLDTYNVSYTKGFELPYLQRGMTGRPTRTVLEFIYQLLQNKKL